MFQSFKSCTKCAFKWTSFVISVGNSQGNFVVEILINFKYKFFIQIEMNIFKLLQKIKCNCEQSLKRNAALYQEVLILDKISKRAVSNITLNLMGVGFFMSVLGNYCTIKLYSRLKRAPYAFFVVFSIFVPLMIQGTLPYAVGMSVN
jgi:hypothetical protein